ncbi:Transcriptional regulatory protein UME6 [Beauveria bassiana D1-5]|uniref:Transcriptional regulatory protein UME6 n=1 Tax=Beauveria bassiana D1-5 TaxID=1245745 RepID=A0A0A2VM76_BEABA|nr:Transcriptional regulatory protein UME6 [Beauveria bassiana D1-5]
MSKPREEIGSPLSPDCGTSLASTTTPLTTPSTTSPQAPIVPVSVPVPVRVRVSGGRNGPRSRQGCWTCRTKKVKCDETRPKCLRCIRLRLLCDYEPRLDVVQESADYIAESYPELVALAMEISPDAHVPEMMATNFRTFMPLYFASLLELHLPNLLLM